MVARWGDDHPAVPLVVVLHGNGTSEHSMIEISPWLPHGPLAYVAVRAPLPAERGFRWFAEVDGRPDPDELAAATQFVLRWLDGEGDRPVLLLAFRGGVTLAGSLLFAAPERFSGAVLLHGALPLDPQPPRGALRGIPVLLAHADDDPRTPQPMLAATRDWLHRWSGAPIRLVQAPGIAVGAALATGRTDLGLALIVGFAVHNVTEGIAIAAALAGDGPPRLPILRLVVLAAVASLPAIPGVWLGGFAFDPTIAAIAFGVATGAVLQVLWIVGRPIVRNTGDRVVAAGVGTGLLAMYLTGLLLSW